MEITVGDTTIGKPKIWVSKWWKMQDKKLNPNFTDLQFFRYNWIIARIGSFNLKAYYGEIDLQQQPRPIKMQNKLWHACKDTLQ